MVRLGRSCLILTKPKKKTLLLISAKAYKAKKQQIEVRNKGVTSLLTPTLSLSRFYLSLAAPGGP